MNIFTNKKQLADYINKDVRTINRMIRDKEIFEIEDLKWKTVYILKDEMIKYLLNNM